MKTQAGKFYGKVSIPLFCASDIKIKIISIPG